MKDLKAPSGFCLVMRCQSQGVEARVTSENPVGVQNSS